MTDRTRLLSTPMLTAIAVAPLALVILAAAFGAPGIVNAEGQGTPLSRLAVLACFVWGVPLAYLAASRLDEFNTAADRFAWFWGAQLGTWLTILFMLAAPALPDLAARGGGAPGEGFAEGVRFVVLAQFAAAIVVGVAWRIAKR